MSYGYWQSRLGGDPAVVGRRLTVDGESREVIGVMPKGFRFLDVRPSLILPLRIHVTVASENGSRTLARDYLLSPRRSW